MAPLSFLSVHLWPGQYLAEPRRSLDKSFRRKRNTKESSALPFEAGLTFSPCDTLSTELYSRQAIRDARLISNPGCYATNTQALLAPLLPYLDPSNPPTIFGISGYSGAGTKTGQSSSDGSPVTLPKISSEDLKGGIRPYALTDHIHEREAARYLSRLGGFPSTKGPDGEELPGLRPAFVPSVAPWFQGILSTMSAPLNKKMTAKEIRSLYHDFYAGNDLVQLKSQGVPEIHEISLKHGIKLGGWQVHSSGRRVVVVSALDNLLKGAATQCIQNLNIALGYDELAGIGGQ